MFFVPARYRYRWLPLVAVAPPHPCGTLPLFLSVWQRNDGVQDSTLSVVDNTQSKVSYILFLVMIMKRAAVLFGSCVVLCPPRIWYSTYRDMAGSS